MLPTILISLYFERRKKLIVLFNTVVLDKGSRSVEVINGFKLCPHFSSGNSGLWFHGDCSGGEYKSNYKNYNFRSG